MKSLKDLSFLLFTILTATGLSASSCEKDEPEPEPRDEHKQLILGKWEYVRDRSGPITNPTIYEEYLPDGTLLAHNYKDKSIIRREYSFADSLLYKKLRYLDQATGDTIVFKLAYKFIFLGNDTLELIFMESAVNTYALYKRKD